MDWYRLAGPLLRMLDAETAHGIAIRALEAGLVPRPKPVVDLRLRVRLWGRDFPNPVGLAAGFDKDGRVPDAALGLGFGFVEVGSVTPRPQPGNVRPRVFRLARAQAIINRLGFNSAGHEVVARRLAARPRSGIVGVNLGRNKNSADAVADYVAGARAFAHVADYLVINVSSPNTPGLRALQGREELGRLIAAVREALDAGAAASRPPLLVKIAPDLAEADLDDIADVARGGGIDGLIATNTTVARPPDLGDGCRDEAGGLSGRPLFAPSTEVLAGMYRRLNGRLPLIGVGGVEDGRTAYAKIRAGASLVQLYTALVYRGPGLARRIACELARLLAADGFASVSDAVGVDHRGRAP